MVRAQAPLSVLGLLMLLALPAFAGRAAEAAASERRQVLDHQSTTASLRREVSASWQQADPGEAGAPSVETLTVEGALAYQGLLAAHLTTTFDDRTRLRGIDGSASPAIPGGFFRLQNEQQARTDLVVRLLDDRLTATTRHGWSGRLDRNAFASVHDLATHDLAAPALAPWEQSFQLVAAGNQKRGQALAQRLDVNVWKTETTSLSVFWEKGTAGKTYFGTLAASGRGWTEVGIETAVGPLAVKVTQAGRGNTASSNASTERVRRAKVSLDLDRVTGGQFGALPHTVWLDHRSGRIAPEDDDTAATSAVAWKAGADWRAAGGDHRLDFTHRQRTAPSEPDRRMSETRVRLDSEYGWGQATLGGFVEGFWRRTGADDATAHTREHKAGATVSYTTAHDLSGSGSLQLLRRDTGGGSGGSLSSGTHWKMEIAADLSPVLPSVLPSIGEPELRITYGLAGTLADAGAGTDALSKGSLRHTLRGSIAFSF